MTPSKIIKIDVKVINHSWHFEKMYVLNLGNFDPPIVILALAQISKEDGMVRDNKQNIQYSVFIIMHHM